MFTPLSERFQTLFSKLTSGKRLTEEKIADAVKEVRLALLDADVHYGVVKHFIQTVKKKALREEMIKSISAGDRFVKIVHDELVLLMGREETPLTVSRSPGVIMLCGLQGSGKTTQAAKLSLMYKNRKRRPLLVACDPKRPAAIEQLNISGKRVGVPVFAQPGQNKPVEVARAALDKAKKEGFDLLILDTAGRTHLDPTLMEELTSLKTALKPDATLFIANAATGQDAVNTAAAFDKEVAITGTILTMLDGNARAGAAISIRVVTGKPLLFEGIGEKPTDLRVFNPVSMADRILGMGDIINLVKTTEEHLEHAESKKIRMKLLKHSFTYGDFLRQLASLKKIGSFESLAGMLPGKLLSGIGDLPASKKEIGTIEAIISSMTHDEREGVTDLSHPRRRRIAKGSGTSTDQVNRMIKQFKRMKQMMKTVPFFKKKFAKEAHLKEMLGHIDKQPF